LHAAGPILNALRNNDFEALREIKDIRPMQNDLDVVLAKAQRKVLLSGQMATLRNEMKQEASDEKVGALPHERLALQLVQCGYNPEIARDCAKAAYDRFAAETDLKLAGAEAFRLAREADDGKTLEVQAKQEKRSGSRKRAAVAPISGDLREIIRLAPKGTPPYEALKASGVIKHATEFLERGADDAALFSKSLSG
jgi:hypothetical protein